MTPTQTQTKTPPQAPQLRLERVFDATPERLWTYWTDPKKYARWLSPQKADLVIHEFDVRVGGKVRFDMPLDDGTVNKEDGVFHVLDRPRLLVTGSPDKSFLLTVTFEAVDAKRTRLTVLADGVPADWHAPAKAGWGTGFDKLAALLRESTSGSTSEKADASAPIRLAGKRHNVSSVRNGILHMERWFAAPPAKVFGAYADAKLLPHFFWPVGTGRVDELVFRVGGRLVMGHTTQPWTATWTFKEIVPDKKIVMTDPFPDSDVVGTGTLEFFPEEGGTRFKISYGPFPETGAYKAEGAAAGFGMGLERLAEAIEVPGEGEGFRIVRYFQAPPKKVWEMWTTKEGLMKWWALSAKDMGFDFKVNTLDVRVGGAYDFSMKNKEHDLHNHGVYTEVTPYTRLAQRWDFDIYLGPEDKPYPVSITIDLEEVPTMDPSGPKGTRMTFTQSALAKAGSTEGSRQGVLANFEKLEKALEA